MLSSFEKLNLKAQKQIIVLNAPESFESDLAALRGVKILRDLEHPHHIEFSLAFVTQQSEINTLAKPIAKKAKGDAVVWFAYPKGTSKRYKSEINRDRGWPILGDAGFETVRAIAIDEDWSALRFQRVEFVKTLRREEKRAMSAQGKKRVTRK